MFNNLAGLAMGLVVFAITIGVGTVVLSRFAGGLATCNDVSVYNYTLETCHQITNHSNTSTPTNAGYSDVTSLVTELGTGGLAGWAAAIVALAVGLLFITALMGGRGRKY